MSMRDKVAKIAYRYIPKLSEANKLLVMVDEYVEQESRETVIKFETWLMENSFDITPNNESIEFAFNKWKSKQEEQQ